MISVEPRVWYNPELRSALFLVPGLIAYIGMISSVVSTALSVVREKERGTMEQVRMAPLGTGSFIVGKTLPYFLISICSSTAIIFASMVLFGLPMRGSWLLLFLSLSLYLAGALGLGLMISTIAESQQVAFQMALLSSFLPTMMLSGFVYPIASMPAPIQQALRMSCIGRVSENFRKSSARLPSHKTFSVKKVRSGVLGTSCSAISNAVVTGRRSDRVASA